MKKNIIIALVGACVLGGGITGVILIPDAIATSNYQKAIEAETNGNIDEARRHYETAAKHHNADALYRMGEFYRADSTTWGKAFESYKEAFERGNMDAACPLAKMLINGVGVKKDAKQGFEYLKEAAEKENIEACMLLGYCYENGIGTIRDEQKAFQYYQYSATQDNPDGLFMLASCYLRGIGVKIDEQKGLSLLEESAKLGCDDAKEFLMQQEQERKRQERERKRQEAEQRRRNKRPDRCPFCLGTGVTETRYSTGKVTRSICIFCDGQGWLYDD